MPARMRPAFAPSGVAANRRDHRVNFQPMALVAFEIGLALGVKGFYSLTEIIRAA